MLRETYSVYDPGYSKFRHAQHEPLTKGSRAGGQVMRHGSLMYRHVHLDPVGGMAGDMFAAALLDTWPELEPDLLAALRASGLSSLVDVKCYPHKDHALTGSRWEVKPVEQPLPHHRAYGEIRDWLQASALSSGIKNRAHAILKLLAEAESKVHGVRAEEVTFHEVGAWDSIADIVVAAWLIDAVAAASWSCAPLPMGRGRVHSAHGVLPVPAPASTLLLEGFPLYQDDYDGERITPTGAAILRHLEPSFAPLRAPMYLKRSGVGFGLKRLADISNILRIFAFETTQEAIGSDQVAICQFEVDDQTAEDLAVALDHLRTLSGVLDVNQTPVFGKKGRMGAHIQVLTRPEAVSAVIEQSFTETTTLGIRWQIAQRAVLMRNGVNQEIDGHSVHVKLARRPHDTITAKAEMADLAETEGGFANRDTLRRRAQAAALTSRKDDSEENDNA